MSSCGLPAAVLLVCVLTFATAQSSCKERCGMGYYRGNTCQCDYSCLRYGECCRDFEDLCTTKDSCKGRCGETFKRGRLCNCDAECEKYNQCCPDYTDHCNEEEVNGEENVAAPAKPDSCGINVEKKPSEPTREPTEQPIEDPFTEGNDPDNFNPTSYPQDDPDSASKQVLQDTGAAGADPIPLPEGASGSPPTDLVEDLTTGPPVPDLDGFEIPPEPVTSSTETTTALSTEETTPGSTTAAPTTAGSTAGSTAADTTISPEPTTVVNIVSTQPTPDPTTSFTEPQTEPPQTTVTTVTTEPTPPSSETTTLVPDTTTTVETTEEMTTLTSEPSATPENTEQTTHPQTTTQEVTTVPATTTEVTTAATEMPTTESPSPSTSAPAETTTEMSTAATTNAELETTTAKEQDVTQSPTSSPTTKPAEKPSVVKPFKPVLSPEHKPVLNGLGVDQDYQADDSNDTNLCSGRPITGVTTLSNGTVVVFRGHYFWVLDPNRVPGPARGITEAWGIPSPIDTVFTRCNCQGKTYIFKGPQYWRYENDALDPGYPKVVQTGFDGLRGHITAALSVPQHNQRRESVYFFKRGGTVQKYAYQFGTNPSCGRKVHYAVYNHGNRIARQAPAQVSLLEPAINYRTSWRGFPTTITAAVSIPNRRDPEGYNYYVFSRSKSYRIRMNGDRPVVAASKSNASPHSNEVFKCPKKVSRSQ